MKQLLQSLDLPSLINLITNIVTTLSVLVVPLYGIAKCIYINNINRDLKKWLSRETLKSLNYYVDTHGQQVDPCENDEIKKNQEFNMSKKLVFFFMKEVFKNNIPNQYFIVLADSGMGKTTFMIKLYKIYMKKWLKSFNMKLIPLSYASALIRIDEVKNPQNTILLLDGLDENPSAMENYEEFMHELLDKTEMFYKIIITCRTQFFPNEKAEPYETGKIMFATNNKNNTFYKIYISPFSNKDITHFLKKKYKFFNKKKREKAKEIVEKCPYLMVRPMLLSYIDDFIVSEREYDYLFQIYEQLVENWIKREAVSSEVLYSFTKQTAIEMYCNNSIYITREEIAKLCKKYNINLKSIEARSKSLLNRNGLGLYKFAHRSIYEYVLAKEALQNADFRKIYDFNNLDMAKFFLSEMLDKEIKNILLVPIVSFDFSRLRISNVNFTDKNLTESIFNETIFDNCKFCNCEMYYTELNKCEFNNCDMTHIDLIMAVIEFSKFYNCILINANLNRIALKKCDIIESDLSHSHICYAKISSSKFIKSNMANSNISNSNFVDNVFEKMILAPLIYNNFKANSEVMEEIIIANKISSHMVMSNGDDSDELQFIDLDST